VPLGNPVLLQKAVIGGMINSALCPVAQPDERSRVLFFRTRAAG